MLPSGNEVSLNWGFTLNSIIPKLNRRCFFFLLFLFNFFTFIYRLLTIITYEWTYLRHVHFVIRYPLYPAILIWGNINCKLAIRTGSNRRPSSLNGYPPQTAAVITRTMRGGAGDWILGNVLRSEVDLGNMEEDRGGRPELPVLL